MTSETYPGKRWTRIRRQAIERDDRRCQSCGTRENLDVHHIKPVESFDVEERAHYLANVVVLCRSCHNKWEGIDHRPVLLDADAGLRLNPVVTELVADTLMQETKLSNLESVYSDVIQPDPEICTQCHRRVRSYAPPPEEHWRKTVRDLASGRSTAAHAGVLCYPPPTDEAAHAEPRVVCDDCGHIESDARSRKKKRLIKHAHHLRDRLLEKGYPVDDDTFYDTIRELKSKSNHSSRDFDILSEATAAAIRTAMQTRQQPGVEKTSNAPSESA